MLIKDNLENVGKSEGNVKYKTIIISPPSSHHPYTTTANVLVCSFSSLFFSSHNL